MHTETLQSRTETDYRRFLDMHEAVPQEDLLQRIADRYGIAGEELAELSRGDKVVESPANTSAGRGLFEHSTATYLDASPSDSERADRYLYHEASTAIFEAVSNHGHVEQLTYEVNQTNGDAFITPGKQFGETYLMDMAYPTYKWRARLSFVEWFNNEAIAELSRRGELADNVVVEFSLFPYHAEVSQAAAVGYNPENYKSFIRTNYTNTSVTERTIETLSYSDMLPSDIQLLRGYFGMAASTDADAETILAEPLVIPKSWYEANDGIGGLARLVDRIKYQQTGNTYRFGQKTLDYVRPEDYTHVAELSARRKEQAQPVIRQLMRELIQLAEDSRAGMLPPESRRAKTNDLVLAYRMKLLKNDIHLAEEQYGTDVAASLVYLNQLESEGRYAEAGQLEQSLHEEFGTIYICGAAVRVNREGEVVNEKGEVEKCPEVKNGQSVTCPGCRQVVKVIVDAKERLYCPRSDCKLSKSGGKGSVATDPAPDATNPPADKSAQSPAPAQDSEAAPAPAGPGMAAPLAEGQTGHAGQAELSGQPDQPEQPGQHTQGQPESSSSQPAQRHENIGAIALSGVE